MIRNFLIFLAFALVCCQPQNAYADVPVESLSIPQSAPYMNLGVPGTAVPSASGFTSIYFIGDSLTAGILNRAPAYFPGWTVGMNGVGGRPLNDGMGILAGTKLPPRTILAMGLFTNDIPTRTWALKKAIRESIRRVGPNGCVIWSTIYRPAVGGPSWYGALPGDATPRPNFPQSALGVDYSRANTIIRTLAKHNRTMRLVDWDKSLHTWPVPMEDNDVHPATDEGWERRAAEYATAARSC